MNINNLNKKITLQKLTFTVNENGFESEIWEDYKTVFASINNLYGREYWSALQVNAENTVNFIIRYSSEFESLDTKKTRISWNNKFYNITFIDNIKYSNTYLLLKGAC